MASLLINILGATIGIGGVVASIAVPATLLSSTSEQTREKRDTHEQEKLKKIDFKNDCFGGFLKQERKGELIVCLEKASNLETPKPVFYLHWTEGSGENFWKIKKVTSVEMQSKNYSISFELEEQRETKTLTVERLKHQGLRALQEADLQKIQKRCRESSVNEESYQLQCHYWNGGDYNKKAVKNWSSSSIE